MPHKKRKILIVFYCIEVSNKHKKGARMIGSVNAACHAGVISGMQIPRKSQSFSSKENKSDVSFTSAEDAVGAVLGKTKGLGKILFWGGIGSESLSIADAVHKFHNLEMYMLYWAGISAAVIALGFGLQWGSKKIHDALWD